MKVGSSEESLLNTVKELDSVTNIDSVLNPQQQISIKATRQNGHLSNWSIMEDYNMYKTKSIQKIGSTYNSLESALKDLNKTENVDFSFSVLCYFETETTRTWDNKIISKWFNILPEFPFSIKNENPVFHYETLELDESEYKIMMETRLAFYNNKTNDIYPIRSVACKSIGVLMDNTSIFKHLPDIPLGSAIILSEKLLRLKSIKFIYREKTDAIKPLIGLAGARYTQYSQYDFFNDVIKYISKKSFYDVTRWSVTDERTIMDVVVNAMNPNCKICLKVQTGDIPGAALSIMAYAIVGKTEIFIARNRSYHGEKFVKDGGVSTLFNGIFESIEDFINRYESLDNTEILFDANNLSALYQILGKKRSKNVPVVNSGVYEKKSLYDLILSTYCKLPEKQSGMLMRFYEHILNVILVSPEFVLREEGTRICH